MSAQEREALVRLVWDDETTYAEAAELADKIIAAGWRPVPAAGRSEAEIKAEGWDAAVRECHALGWLHDFALSDALARNPYRAARLAGTTDTEVSKVRLYPGEGWPTSPLHRTEAGWPNCATCDGGGCPDCTDSA